ncbi:MBL fold metallo-hydrolase [Lysinibacillus sp. TE18511]
MTHGHFDHVGAIIDLIEYWGMAVYTHPLTEVWRFSFMNVKSCSK